MRPARTTIVASGIGAAPVPSHSSTCVRATTGSANATNSAADFGTLPKATGADAAEAGDGAAAVGAAADAGASGPAPAAGAAPVVAPSAHASARAHRW